MGNCGVVSRNEYCVTLIKLRRNSLLKQRDFGVDLAITIHALNDFWLVTELSSDLFLFLSIIQHLEERPTLALASTPKCHFSTITKDSKSKGL